MGIYLLVFSLLWQHVLDVDHYALFLLSGLAVWIVLRRRRCRRRRASMLDNANLIRKVRFPRQLVPLSVVATQLVDASR